MASRLGGGRRWEERRGVGQQHAKGRAAGQRQGCGRGRCLEERKEQGNVGLGIGRRAWRQHANGRGRGRDGAGRGGEGNIRAGGGGAKSEMGGVWCVLTYDARSPPTPPFRSKRIARIFLFLDLFEIPKF
ncbi:hypothetical protein GUJ93_ZPchr0002g24566 [Zizania palustris]|uniref:Uncharacterized protein n=1 Tax=Zizania palustris TaxID=103762 RepID=A0A8J5RZY4_ZIZPA|nr:hypothetical protein GUJ93_ZPchr0002g24566 [Zizania palustris]